jgi:hypothetical protein
VFTQLSFFFAHFLFFAHFPSLFFAWLNLLRLFLAKRTAPFLNHLVFPAIFGSTLQVRIPENPCDLFKGIFCDDIFEIAGVLRGGGCTPGLGCATAPAASSDSARRTA